MATFYRLMILLRILPFEHYYQIRFEYMETRFREAIAAHGVLRFHFQILFLFICPNILFQLAKRDQSLWEMSVFANKNSM